MFNKSWPKIIFAGTPEFAQTILSKLLEHNFDICAVYTQPDKPSGRGQLLTASPVKHLALKHNIPVIQPLTFKNNPEALSTLDSFNADVMIVAAYGLILPKEVLKTPKNGCINIHASILPKWRGATPIQHAIWRGDNETGITIMQMDIGMDTGNILKIATIPLLATDTSASLHQKLAILGANTLLAVLPDLEKYQLTSTPQDNTQAIYTKKINKELARIDFNLDAVAIERAIRAFIPWPIAFTLMDNTVIKVFKAAILDTVSNHQPGIIINNKDFIDVATKTNNIRLLEIQLPGGKRLSTKEVLNGHSTLFALSKQFK